MRSEEFAQTPDFTEMEIGETGANYGDVKLSTMLCAQGVRTDLDRAVHIFDNGLTTGKHKSKEHPAGEAIDFWVDGNPNPMLVICAMLANGFTGIGAYVNEKNIWSYHGDTGKRRNWLIVDGGRQQSIFNEIFWRRK